MLDLLRFSLGAVALLGGLAGLAVALRWAGVDFDPLNPT